MGRLKRYFTLFRIFISGGGYSRAEYLKKKKYFKSMGGALLPPTMEFWNRALHD